MKKENFPKLKKKHFIILGFVILAILGFAFFKANLSGNIILKLDAEYHEGENLDGILKLSLSNGEFIPASSKVIFETSEQRQEFTLKDILSEQPIEGIYYIQNRNLSGQGMGYGLIGSKKIYPEISFKFNIYSESKKAEGKAKQKEEVEEITETINEMSGKIEEVSEEETVAPTESIETTPEAESVNVPAEETTEATDKEDVIETTNEEVTGEEVEEREEEQVEEVEVEEREEEQVEEVEVEEEVKEEKEELTITGRIISTISMSFASLLHLTPTGQVILNLETTIPGKVSADNPFTYNLEKGQTAELISRSVTDGSGILNDNSIKFKILDDSIIVSTDYSKAEEGFGINYIENEFQIFQINLSAINLNFTKGDLNITFIYNDEKIVSLSVILQEGKTDEINELIPIEIPKFSSQNLTENEKQILIQKFGNVSVETTRAEVLNGRLIRNYKIGDYELTASYDYNSNITASLEEQMEKDKLNFLRDLIRMISKEKTISKNVDEFLGSSDF